MAARTSRFPFPIHVNIANFVTIKLNEDNFLLWQAQVLCFLRSQDLIGFITGETARPVKFLSTEGVEDENVNLDYTDWIKTDQLVTSWLNGAVSENILGLIIGLETSFAVWQVLLNRFTQKSVAREYELRGKLQVCQKRSRTLAEYLREYKTICDQLNAIGKPVDDITKIFGVLEGLGSEYESFRTTMYCLKPQPEYDEVLSQLERFETRLQTYSSSSAYTPNLAFYGQQKTESVSQIPFMPSKDFSRGGRFSGRGRGMSSRGRSVYPGRSSSFRPKGVSHRVDNQLDRPSDSWSGFGQGFRPYSRPSSSYQAVNSYPPVTLPSTKAVQVTKPVSSSLLECQICRRPGHGALHCWYRFDNSYQTEDIPTALAAFHLEDPQGHEWYPDTGASAHITSDAGILLNSSQYTGLDTVMIGDGSRLPITCIGHAVLNTPMTSFPLNDVLIVPDIKKNMLSVARLTDDYPCSFTFDKTGVYIKDLPTNTCLKLG